MECEICGKSISNNPKKTKIDGSIMNVCEECAKFGVIQKEQPKLKPKKNKIKINKNKPLNKQSYSEEPEELIENYNETIKKVRESKNWTREELGRKINEKVSVINRIESGKMVPDSKLIKKLEKVLNIELLEKMESDDLNQFKNNSPHKQTLGNIVKIKKK